MKNITFNWKNFSLQNTPAIAQTIGNICLIFALVGGSITFLQTQLPPPHTLPILLVDISIWATAIGSLGKFITKFLGTTTIN